MPADHSFPEFDPPDSPVGDGLDVEFDAERTFRISSPNDTDQVDSPDAACDLMCDLVAEQFWDWWDSPVPTRRFKPRVKVYEVG